jgi:hypothetical protein
MKKNQKQLAVKNFAPIHIKTNSTFEMFSIPIEFEQILKEKCSQFLEKMRIENPLNLVKNLEVEQDYYVSGEFFFNGLTNKIEIWVKAKQMEITYPEKV